MILVGLGSLIEGQKSKNSCTNAGSKHKKLDYQTEASVLKLNFAQLSDNPRPQTRMFGWVDPQMGNQIKFQGFISSNLK